MSTTTSNSTNTGKGRQNRKKTDNDAPDGDGKRVQNDSNHKSPTKSLLRGVDMMSLKDKQAVLTAADQLNIYFKREYGAIGNFIETNEYFKNTIINKQLADIELLEGFTADDKLDLKKKLLLEDLKSKREEAKLYQRMYADLLSVLDAEGKNKLNTNAEYLTLKDTDCSDPLSLWEIIVQIYTAGPLAGKTITELDHEIAKREFNSIRQGQKSVLDYKLEFESGINKLKQIGASVPTDAEIAIAFLCSSDKTRYGMMIDELNYDVKRGKDKYPKTLQDAVDMMLDYKISTEIQILRKMAQKNVISGRPTAFMGAKVQQNKSGTANNSSSSSGSTGDKTSKEIQQIRQKKMETFPCHNCGELGHWKRDCKKPDSSTSNSNPDSNNSNEHAFKSQNNSGSTGGTARRSALNVILSAIDNDVEIDRDLCVYDTGATDIFVNDPDMVTEQIVCDPVEAVGATGPVVLVIKGVLGKAGEVYVDRKLPVTLVGNCLEAKFKVDYIQREKYVVHCGKTPLEFSYNKVLSLYTCSKKHLMEALSLSNPSMYISTVQKNQLGYSKMEADRADAARTLMKRLGHCSIAEAERMLNCGNLLDCPLTSADVDRSVRIYGAPLIGREKGYMVDAGNTGINRSEGAQILRVQQIGHADVMHIANQAYLVTVFKPLNLVVTTELKAVHYNANDIQEAIETQLQIINAKGMDVDIIYTDRDSPLVALKRVNNTSIVVAAGGAHENVAERTIRAIKDKFRAITTSLPFDLPQVLVRPLVFYCTKMLNIVNRSSSIGVSAYEAYFGKKISLKKDLKLEFGAYALVYVNSKAKNDVFQAKCAGGVCVGPCLNDRGSQMFYIISTRRMVASDNFKEVPMPEEAIEALNMADAKVATDTIASEDDDSDYVPSLVDDDDSDDDYEPEDAGEILDVPVPELHAPEVAIPSEATGLFPPQLEIINTTVDLEEILDSTELEDLPDQVKAHNKHWALNYITCALKEEPMVDVYDRVSLTKALKIDPEEALAGAHREVTALVSTKTMSFMHYNDIPTECRDKIIPVGMFMKQKVKKGKKIWKSRVFVLGNLQQSMEKFAVYAGTVSLTTVMIFFAWVAHLRQSMIHMDIDTAFLNCTLDEVIHIKINKQISDIIVSLYPEYSVYQNEKGEMFALLLKALYGLKQAPRLWYLYLRANLEALGYTINPEDECMFHKVVDGKVIDVCYYVDDILMSHPDKDVLMREAHALGKRFSGYTITEDTEGMKYLGMEIKRNANMDLMVSMVDYTNKIVNEVNVVKKCNMPGTKLDFQEDMSPLLTEVADVDVFRSRVAKLLFLAKRTRADILLQVSVLASCVNAPTVKNQKQLSRVFSYLLNEPNRGLIFNGGGEMRLEGWGDAAFMLHSDLISRTGVILMLNGAVIEAHSCKQPLRVKSPFESELVQFNQTADWVMGVVRVMRGQGMEVSHVPIYQDNRAVIDAIKAGKPTSHRTKHIALRYYNLKDLVLAGEIDMIWVSTHVMLADVLTKVTDKVKFVQCRDVIARRLD